jgi:hypothetical protein
VFSTQITIGEPEIAAPYDLGFQLRHYVIAPEVREAQTLVEIVRLSSGGPGGRSTSSPAERSTRPRSS